MKGPALKNQLIKVHMSLVLQARVVGLFPFCMALHMTVIPESLVLLLEIYSPKMKGPTD